MKTVTNIQEYNLFQAGRLAAKAEALQALEAHLARLNDRSAFSDFEHNYHRGSRHTLEFAISLVKISL